MEAFCEPASRLPKLHTDLWKCTGEYYRVTDLSLAAAIFSTLKSASIHLDTNYL